MNTFSSAFWPQGRTNFDWDVVHKAACAAIYRGIVDRGVDITRIGLTADTDRLEAKIRHVVEMTGTRSLERIVRRDIDKHGPLPGGWSMRWGRVENTSAAPPPLPSPLNALD